MSIREDANQVDLRERAKELAREAEELSRQAQQMRENERDPARDAAASKLDDSIRKLREIARS